MTVKLLQSFNLICGCYFTSRAPPRVPPWELTISLFKGTFESMMFLFPRWDMLVPWRVGLILLMSLSFLHVSHAHLTSHLHSGTSPSSPGWPFPTSGQTYGATNSFVWRWAYLIDGQGLERNTFLKSCPKMVKHLASNFSMPPKIREINSPRLSQVYVFVGCVYLPFLLRTKKIAVQDADWRARFQVVFVNAMGRPEQGQDAGWSWRIH